MGLTPAKARKTAERAADAWEQDIRQEYEKQCALTALGKIYQIPAEKRRDDFCAFVNDTWFPLQVRDGKHKSKTINQRLDNERLSIFAQIIDNVFLVG